MGSPMDTMNSAMGLVATGVGLTLVAKAAEMPINAMNNMAKNTGVDKVKVPKIKTAKKNKKKSSKKK